MVSITLNGEDCEVKSSSLADLIVELNLGASRFAVEHNRQIVPRTDLSSVKLEAGDRVEIVSFVGGG